MLKVLLLRFPLLAAGGVEEPAVVSMHGAAAATAGQLVPALLPVVVPLHKQASEVWLWDRKLSKLTRTLCTLWKAQYWQLPGPLLPFLLSGLLSILSLGV